MNSMITLVSEQMETQEDWQAKVEHLELYVCELLIKNQTLRMALQAERTRVEGHGYAQALSAFSSNG
jgi:hypothetical protein